jgi:hypothetical protein
MVTPVYQLKIVLNGIKPPVWRRVLVRDDTTISFLHEIVQVAMGWYNCHLHRFLIRGKEYGVSYEGGVAFANDPNKIRLSDFRFRPAERFEYQYDFGDNWEHTLTVEKSCLPTLPRRILAASADAVHVRPKIPADLGCIWLASTVEAETKGIRLMPTA